MAEFDEMCQVLCRHDWPSLDCWVDCLCRLADLSDAEICELDRRARSETLAERPAAAA